MKSWGQLMKNNPNNHHRRSIRLKGYDYSQAGAYYVTVCTHNHLCLFGHVVNEKMMLNDPGRMIQSVWDQLTNQFSNIELDEYVIMPNHIHGISFIVGASLVGAQPSTWQGAGTRPAPTVGLGHIVGAFKSIATNEYIRGVKQHGWPTFAGKLWQRNYYERVIRNDVELKRIRQYIVENPMKWEFDHENPDSKIEAKGTA